MTNVMIKLVGLGCAALLTATASAQAAPKTIDVKQMKGAAMVEYAAQPYIRFRDDIDFASATMPQSATAMRDIHQRLASHDTKAMAGSWVAYAAMIAADSPAFSAEIEKRMRKRGAAKFVAALNDDPSLIRNIKGADEAIEAIMAFSASDAAKIHAIGQAYMEEAYTMQKTPWARKAIAESGMKRVDAALSFAATREWPTHVDRKVVRGKTGTIRPNLVSYANWSHAWAGDNAVAADPSARPGGIITKALTLGAHYAMNTVTQEHMAAFGSSRKSERCFSNAKMNLDQCIAATRTPYEEAFCLGQHALNDVSSCVGWPAGADRSGS